MAELGLELNLLYVALNSPRGILVPVSDFQLAQARLYRARKESGDPALDSLSLRRSPRGAMDEVWIVKDKPDGI